MVRMYGWSEVVATSSLLAGSLCTLNELHSPPGDTSLAPSSLWLQPCWQRRAPALPWMLLTQPALCKILCARLSDVFHNTSSCGPACWSSLASRYCTSWKTLLTADRLSGVNQL